VDANFGEGDDSIQKREHRLLQRIIDIIMVHSNNLESNAKKLRQSKLKYQGEIQFHGQPIAQWHNTRILIDEIIAENKIKQFTSILIIGTPGTGKTTLANYLAHGIHSKKPYLVKHFGKKEVLNFENVLDSLPNEDLILIFDDISMVFKLKEGQAKKSEILSALTEARHPKFANSDRKVIIMANIHYMNSIEKMWRSQGGWKIYTDMSNEERLNFNAITKSQFNNKVKTFSKITRDMFLKGKFTLNITKKRTHEYTTDKPFRFFMCYDGNYPRFFMSVKESCLACSEKKSEYMKLSSENVIDLIYKHYGNDGIAGLKMELLRYGNTAQYRNNTIYGYFDAKELLATFDVDNSELADVLRKRAKIPGKKLHYVKKKQSNLLDDAKKLQNTKQAIV